MLQLTLIRHAKSSWKEPGLSDFDRPLNRRGLENAPLIGRIIKESGLTFDRVLSSPALRALTTARLIAGQIDYPADAIEYRAELYEASPAALLRCVQGLDAHDRRCALVGHNPGLTELCNSLAGPGVDNLPTCGVAVIEFEVDDWQAVHPGLGRLARFEYPRKYSESR